MNKRVAILKPTLSASGGLEKYCLRIAHALKKANNEVFFITQNTNEFKNFDFPIHSCKTYSWPPSVKLEQYNQQADLWVNQNKPDIVFGMERTRHQTHYRAGNGCHRAYLDSRLFSDGYLKHLLCKYNPLHRKILEIEKSTFEFSGIKKIFTNSQLVKNQILSFYNTDENKIKVIHNGVEWHEFAPHFSETFANKEQNFQKLFAKTDCFQFLFIGNGFFRKGLKPLLESLGKISRRDFQLHIVGKDKNILFFQKLTQKLKLENNVIFWGSQKSVVDFYKIADCVVIPSYYDPFANVTVEALAMGVYVISSTANGGCEVIHDNGDLFDLSTDNQQLVEKLSRAFKYPKTLQSAINIRQNIKNLDFSIQLQTLLESL